MSWELGLEGFGRAPLEAVPEIHGGVLEAYVYFAGAVGYEVLRAGSHGVERADSLAPDLADPGRRVVKVEAHGEVECVALVLRGEDVVRPFHLARTQDQRVFVLVVNLKRRGQLDQELKTGAFGD